MLTQKYIDKLLRQYSECPVCHEHEISVIEDPVNNLVTIYCDNVEAHDNNRHAIAVLGNHPRSPR